MKKIIVILIIIGLIGCGGITIQKDSTAAMKAAGQALGIAIAANNPIIVRDALPYVNGLLSVAKEGKIDNAAIVQAINLLPIDAQTRTALGIAQAFVTVEIKTGTVNSQLVTVLEGIVAGLNQVKG